MRTLIRTLLLALAVGSLAAPAAAQEYRSVKLADGRVYVGEVIGTDASGMTMRIPSGEILVPFTASPEIGPATAEDVQNQAPWPIIVLATSASPNLQDAAAELSSLVVQQVSTIPHTEVLQTSDLPADQAQELTGCGQSIPCMIRSLQGSGAHHALVPFLEHHQEGSQVRLIALNLPGQEEAGRAEFVAYADLASYPNTVLRIAHEAIGLTPLEPIPDDQLEVLASSDGSRTGDGTTDDDGDGSDEVPDGADLVSGGDDAVDGGGGGSTKVQIQLSDMERRRRVSIGLGFVPFPGLGSAHLKDPGGFVLNTLFAGGAGFGLVYLFGALSPTAVGFYAPAIGATYAVGVLINQISSAVSYRRYELGLTQRRERFAPVVFASPDPADSRAAAVQLGVTRRW